MHAESTWQILKRGQEMIARAAVDEVSLPRHEDFSQKPPTLNPN